MHGMHAKDPPTISAQPLLKASHCCGILPNPGLSLVLHTHSSGSSCLFFCGEVNSHGLAHLFSCLESSVFSSCCHG